jgi:hypothetical protein
MTVDERIVWRRQDAWPLRKGLLPGRVWVLSEIMSPTWVWMQVAIVVFVLAGIVIAITKLA